MVVLRNALQNASSMQNPECFSNTIDGYGKAEDDRRHRPQHRMMIMMVMMVMMVVMVMVTMRYEPSS